MKLLLPLLVALLLIVSTVALLEFGESRAALEIDGREKGTERVVAGSELAEPQAERVVEDVPRELRTDALVTSSPPEFLAK